MIGISKLYCGAVEPADVLRYNRHSGQLPSHLLQFSADKRPVVVWNMTRRCNLKCIHCYSNSDNINYPDELTTEEGKKLIDDLAQFGSPVILFSGGEPFLHKDLIPLLGHADTKGFSVHITTSGYTIPRKMINDLPDNAFLVFSLDGIGKVHDEYRGMPGAYERLIESLEYTRTKLKFNEIVSILWKGNIVQLDAKRFARIPESAMKRFGM